MCIFNYLNQGGANRCTKEVTYQLAYISSLFLLLLAWRSVLVFCIYLKDWKSTKSYPSSAFVTSGFIAFLLCKCFFSHILISFLLLSDLLSETGTLILLFLVAIVGCVRYCRSMSVKLNWALHAWFGNILLNVMVISLLIKGNNTIFKKNQNTSFCTLSVLLIFIRPNLGYNQN